MPNQVFCEVLSPATVIARRLPRSLLQLRRLHPPTPTPRISPDPNKSIPIDPAMPDHRKTVTAKGVPVTLQKDKMNRFPRQVKVDLHEVDFM